MAWIGLVAAIVAANLLVLSPGDLGMLRAQDIRDLLQLSDHRPTRYVLT